MYMHNLKKITQNAFLSPHLLHFQVRKHGRGENTKQKERKLLEMLMVVQQRVGQ
jgi:hypothetical protein